MESPQLLYVLPRSASCNTRVTIIIYPRQTTVTPIVIVFIAAKLRRSFVPPTRLLLVSYGTTFRNTYLSLAPRVCFTVPESLSFREILMEFCCSRVILGLSTCYNSPPPNPLFLYDSRHLIRRLLQQLFNSHLNE